MPSPLARALPALLALACLARPAVADEGLRLSWGNAALLGAGAATAFVAHESGHLVANYAYGNDPRLEPVRYMGSIPFFSIDPGISCDDRGRCRKRDGSTFDGGRRGLFVIESAGIQVQQYTDELILTLAPRLREDDAPFVKGLLAFNVALSVGYVASSWAGTEPPAGDLRALRRDTGAPRAMNWLVLGVAALDTARYFCPDARWLAWLSRAGKVATTGLVLEI